ncbi:hypothetical protein [Pygmaiobacter massiliensis]|uniref:hypothetical protein n=1 Tax=Pygmaiobacter massiliensis TaxID=1917873 RepID=UPI000C7B85AC|nr:hypothetical protein [Pygmaiobacter massiliensis]
MNKKEWIKYWSKIWLIFNIGAFFVLLATGEFTVREIVAAIPVIILVCTLSFIILGIIEWLLWKIYKREHLKEQSNILCAILIVCLVLLLISLL